jgi:hypothetical protein
MSKRAQCCDTCLPAFELVSSHVRSFVARGRLLIGSAATQPLVPALTLRHELMLLELQRQPKTTPRSHMCVNSRSPSGKRKSGRRAHSWRLKLGSGLWKRRYSTLGVSLSFEALFSSSPHLNTFPVLRGLLAASLHNSCLWLPCGGGRSLQINLPLLRTTPTSRVKTIPRQCGARQNDRPPPKSWRCGDNARALSVASHSSLFWRLSTKSTWPRQQHPTCIVWHM